eukprot:1159232-Pelagomonas_calceolata.AAC.13
MQGKDTPIQANCPPAQLHPASYFLWPHGREYKRQGGAAQKGAFLQGGAIPQPWVTGKLLHCC